MYKIDATGIESLQRAMKDYAGNVEEAVNDVLHNQAGQLIQESVQRLIPESRAKWAGKKAPAKTSKSLRTVNENLAVTVTTTKNYQYLYFPDDGTSTDRHVGNKQFFAAGGEAVRSEVIDRCIKRLVEEF